MAEQKSLEEIFQSSESPKKKKGLPEIFGKTPTDLAVAQGSSGMMAKGVQSVLGPLQGLSPQELAVGAGAGAAVAGFHNYMNAPKIEMFEVDQQLKNINSQAGLPSNIRLEDSPTLLTDRKQIAASKFSQKQVEMSAQFNTAKEALGQRLKEFDDVILRNSVDDASKIITENYKQFTMDAYKAYGSGLDAIESGMEKAGVSFDVSKFNEEVIDSTIKDAIAQGVPEEKLKTLKQIKGKNIALGKAKGIVKNAASTLPREAQFKITENWAKFMESNAPDSAKKALKELNSQYAPFAESRKTLNKVINPKTGTFDRVRLNKFLTDMAKKGEDAGRKDLFKLIKEGNKLISPLKDVGPTIEKLNSASISRSEILQATDKLKKIDIESIANLKTQAREAEQRFLQYRTKAKELVSRKGAIVDKAPLRTKGIGGVISKATGLTQRFGGKILSVLPFAQVIQLINDKEGTIAQQMGVTLPQKGTKERKVLENLVEKMRTGKEFNEEERAMFNKEFGT